MTCTRCGKPAAETWGGLCGRCRDLVVDGMAEALDQGEDAPRGGVS